MKTMQIIKTALTWMCLYFMVPGIAQDEKILVPQTGYPATLNKIAVIREPADSFFVSGSDNKVLYAGKLSKAAFWPYSEEQVQLADFSLLKTPGTYFLHVTGSTAKRKVLIVGDPFGEIAGAAVRAFYFNRCSYPILAEYGGKWERSAGHPDRVVYVHRSAVSENRPEGFILSSPGGWYDAGDYNKYIVNSGITTYTMLLAYESYPDYWKSKNLNLPESKNRIPDILDETLYNLRWMLTMQDDDGGVYHKLTTKQFEPFIMPVDAHEKRYVVQKNTAASLDFAAVMAHASRILSDFSAELPGLADTCRKAALAAWNWSRKNPSVLYRQPEDIGTGAYGDSNLSDEWFWAGVEIALVSGSAFPDSMMDRIDFRTPSWDHVATLGLITAVINRENINAPIYAKCHDAFFRIVGQLIDKAGKAAYPVSIDYFAWGSNSDVANQGLMKMVAYALQDDPVYLHAAVNDLNYITGVNPTGYCFITGFGDKSPMKIHHRVSGADKVPEPVPGFLAGGPNTATFADCPEVSRSRIPALSYIDEECSYSTNEIAINWNAPLVFLAGAISYSGSISIENK